jgi:hypothetical protein
MDRGSESDLQPSDKPPLDEPYALRPAERAYFVGWLLWAVAGAWFIFRGVVEGRAVFTLGGSAAVLLGACQAAVIAIRPLRPWRKVVGVVATVIILAAIIVVYALDLFRQRL